MTAHGPTPDPTTPDPTTPDPTTPDPTTPDPDDLPEQSSDDAGVGWGDEAREDAESDRDAWYLSERPPHHGT